MNLKQKFLNWIYESNQEFFQDEVKKGLIEKDLNDLKRAHLTQVFEQNKHFFELLLVKDFIGYIPKQVNEPAFKIFEEQGEALERWILWQSYDINNRAVNDLKKVMVYQGMMIYLKVLLTLAREHKKERAPVIPKITMKEEKSWVDEALEDVEAFSYGLKNQGNKDTTTQNGEGTKA